MIGGYNQNAKDKPLKPYQITAAEWLLDRWYVQGHKGCGLFLDPGLGKTRVTLTAIDYLMKLGEIRKVLIVAPLRPVYFVWPAEIREWGFPQSNIVLHNQMTQALKEDCQIEIINYESLAKLKGFKRRWDLLVLDESTWIKTWGTQRAKSVRAVLPTIPKRLILTGTPGSNSLGDLHSQIYVLDDGESLGKTVTYFRSTYMTRGGFQGRQWILQKGREKELQDLIRDKTLRMQAEDHLDMPRIVKNDVWIELPANCAGEYNRLKRELKAHLDAGELLVGSAAAAYAKCRQFANGTVYQMQDDDTKISIKVHDEKIQAICDVFEELSGKPLLIFYNYSHDRERLLARPQFRRAPVIRGKMKMAEVKKILANWNEGAYPAILCQWQAASHGLNMQRACNDVACFGVVDSPDTYDQAFRRVYRQGVQGTQVRIHRFLARKTVDAVMLDRLEGKIATQDAFLQALKRHGD